MCLVKIFSENCNIDCFQIPFSAVANSIGCSSDFGRRKPAVLADESSWGIIFLALRGEPSFSTIIASSDSTSESGKGNLNPAFFRPELSLGISDSTLPSSRLASTTTKSSGFSSLNPAWPDSEVSLGISESMLLPESPLTSPASTITTSSGLRSLNPAWPEAEVSLGTSGRLLPESSLSSPASTTTTSSGFRSLNPAWSGADVSLGTSERLLPEFSLSSPASRTTKLSGFRSLNPAWPIAEVSLGISAPPSTCSSSGSGSLQTTYFKQLNYWFPHHKQICAFW